MCARPRGGRVQHPAATTPREGGPLAGRVAREDEEMAEKIFFLRGLSITGIFE